MWPDPLPIESIVKAWEFWSRWSMWDDLMISTCFHDCVRCVWCVWCTNEGGAGGSGTGPKPTSKPVNTTSYLQSVARHTVASKLQSWDLMTSLSPPSLQSLQSPPSLPCEPYSGRVSFLQSDVLKDVNDPQPAPNRTGTMTVRQVPTSFEFREGLSVSSYGACATCATH